ncbi:hypothetical protein D3C86_2023060 [compost metagenome]
MALSSSKLLLFSVETGPLQELACQRWGHQAQQRCWLIYRNRQQAGSYRIRFRQWLFGYFPPLPATLSPPRVR